MTQEEADRVHEMATQILTESDLASRTKDVCDKLQKTDGLDLVLTALITALLSPLAFGIKADHPDARENAAEILHRIEVIFGILVEGHLARSH